MRSAGEYWVPEDAIGGIANGGGWASRGRPGRNAELHKLYVVAEKRRQVIVRRLVVIWL